MAEAIAKPAWGDILKAFLEPRMLKLLFLGFSAGVPYALIFSTLSFWLVEAKVDKSTITFFGWAALGYSFKFVWAPLVDRLPLPVLNKLLGRRRAWMLFAQCMIIVVLLFMGSIDPATSTSTLQWMALAAVALGFSAATQDIVIDAYRIEAASTDHQTILATMYMCGYRIAMIASGAGALYLATWFGTSVDNYQHSAWQMTYVAMAALMLVGVVTTLVIAEPSVSKRQADKWATTDYSRFLVLFAFMVSALIMTYVLTSEIVNTSKSVMTQWFNNKHLAGFIGESGRLSLALGSAALAAVLATKVGVVNRSMVIDVYLEPIRDFFSRYGIKVALLLLALIGLYRISDIVLGMIAYVFYYEEMGFTKNQVATASKVYGLIMTILGGFIGGAFALRYGVIRLLYVGALLSALTNLLFIWLYYSGNNLSSLYIVLSLDNFAQGMSLSVFIAFLSSLTNVSFTAMQYAIFSSLMSLLPKVIGGYSGTIVNQIGYPTFFTLTALMGIPILWLVYKVSCYVKDGKLISQA